MKRLFLCSLFKDVKHHLIEFAKEDLAGKTITYIPTAAICEKYMGFHIRHSKKLLRKMGLVVDELDLSTAKGAEITSKIEKNDCIYVGGGNTFFLLQEMVRSGAGDLLKEQIELGKLYIGESAGAILSAPNIAYISDMDDPGKAQDLQTYDAMNIIDFYPLPHVGDFTQKKNVEKITQKYEKTLPLVPITNSQVIVVTGTERRIIG